MLFGLGRAVSLLSENLRLPAPTLAVGRVEGLAAYAIGALASFWTVERVVGFWV